MAPIIFDLFLLLSAFFENIKTTQLLSHFNTNGPFHSELYGFMNGRSTTDAAVTLTPVTTSKQYRTDYEYNRETDAFYKLHIESVSKYTARMSCEAEGAKLMTPSQDFDIAQAHGMLKRFPDIGNYAWVDDDGEGHESAEEQPIIDLNASNDDEPFRLNSCDAVKRTGEIQTIPCYRGLPFFCKVNAKEAPFDKTCNVYGKGYQYIESVGSCYKLSAIADTWNAGYAECRAEGAHLVVLNSEAEHQVLWNITQRAPELRRSRASWFFFAGFRANQPADNKTKVFLTIFNQTLEEAGYNEWTANEPNNALNNENCGSIFKNDGKLNDLDCTHDYGFICEKEIHV